MWLSCVEFCPLNVVRKVKESQRSPRNCNLKIHVHMRTPRGVRHRHHVLASTHAPYSVCLCACVWARMCVRVCRFKPVRSRPKGGVYPGMFQFFSCPPQEERKLLQMYNKRTFPSFNRHFSLSAHKRQHGYFSVTPSKFP